MIQLKEHPNSWPELDTLHALWVQVGQQTDEPHLRTTSTLAFRAIRCEEQSRHWLTTIENITTISLREVSSMCEALDLLQQALEAWIEAEARIFLNLHEEKQEDELSFHLPLQQLFTCCTNQQQRVIDIYLRLQNMLAEACNTHHILLTIHPFIDDLIQTEIVS